MCNLSLIWKWNGENVGQSSPSEGFTSLIMASRWAISWPNSINASWKHLFLIIVGGGTGFDQLQRFHQSKDFYINLFNHNVYKCMLLLMTAIFKCHSKSTHSAVIFFFNFSLNLLAWSKATWRPMQASPRWTGSCWPTLTRRSPWPAAWRTWTNSFPGWTSTTRSGRFRLTPSVKQP